MELKHRTKRNQTYIHTQETSGCYIAPALNLHATRKCQYGSALSELNMQTECQTPLTPDYTQKPNKTSERSLGKIMKLGNQEKYVNYVAVTFCILSSAVFDLTHCMVSCLVNHNTFVTGHAS